MVVICIRRFVAIKLNFIPLTACINASKERTEEQSGLKMRALGMGVLSFK
jgi:hypothetical protein